MYSVCTGSFTGMFIFVIILNKILPLSYYYAPINSSSCDDAKDDLEDDCAIDERTDDPTQLMENTQDAVTTQMNYNTLVTVSEVTVSDFCSSVRSEPSVWQCSVTRAEDVVWTLSQSRCTNFMTFLVLLGCTWTPTKVKIFKIFGQKLTPHSLCHVLNVLYLTLTWCPVDDDLMSWPCPGVQQSSSVISRDVTWCQVPGLLHGHLWCQCVPDDGNICVSLQYKNIGATVPVIISFEVYALMRNIKKNGSVLSTYYISSSVYLDTINYSRKGTEASLFIINFFVLNGTSNDVSPFRCYSQIHVIIGDLIATFSDSPDNNMTQIGPGMCEHWSTLYGGNSSGLLSASFDVATEHAQTGYSGLKCHGGVSAHFIKKIGRIHLCFMDDRVKKFDGECKIIVN